MKFESAVPVTRNCVSRTHSANIRRVIQNATTIDTENARARLAYPDDADAFHAFLSDPAVHAPIYTLPDPLTLANVRIFIERHLQEREDGKGLLFLTFNDEKQLGGYMDLQVWPQWGAGELGGALHPNRQSQGQGAKGAKLAINWMFEHLGLNLVCETAALDNFRTAHLLDGLGFERKGEILSQSENGKTRPSRVWEISKDMWGTNYQSS